MLGCPRRHFPQTQSRQPTFARRVSGRMPDAKPTPIRRRFSLRIRGLPPEWPKMRGRPVSRILSRWPRPPWMTIPLAPPLPTGSSCQPGPLGLKRPCGDIPDRDPGSARARPLFGIAPGGACHAVPVAGTAVGSYPTVSPFPRRTGVVSSLWRFPSGCPGRALPGTAASWSPDFPRRLPAAAIQPSARGWS